MLELSFVKPLRERRAEEGRQGEGREKQAFKRQPHYSKVPLTNLLFSLVMAISNCRFWKAQNHLLTLTPRSFWFLAFMTLLPPVHAQKRSTFWSAFCTMPLYYPLAGHGTKKRLVCFCSHRSISVFLVTEITIQLSLGGEGRVDLQRIASLESRVGRSALTQDLELPPWHQENLEPALQTLAKGKKNHVANHATGTVHIQLT